MEKRSKHSCPQWTLGIAVTAVSVALLAAGFSLVTSLRLDRLQERVTLLEDELFTLRYGFLDHDEYDTTQVETSNPQRHKRQAYQEEEEGSLDPVPIYEQAYGISHTNLHGHTKSNSNNVIDIGSSSVLFRDSFSKITTSEQAEYIPVIQKSSTDINEVKEMKSLAPLSMAPENKLKGKKRPKKRQRIRGGTNTRLGVAHFFLTNVTESLHDIQAHRYTNQWETMFHPTFWMDTLGLSRKYPLVENSITIKEAGIYYIYAQVACEGNDGGFNIFINGNVAISCMVSQMERRKQSTCYSGAASYIPENAIITMKTLHLPAGSSEEMNYFGLLKLMEVPDSARNLI